MSKFVNVAAVVFAAALVLAILIVELWWRRKNPPEKMAAWFEALEARLLSPDWAFYEEHLQRPAPVALRELFADHALVTRGGLNYSKNGGLSRFNPLTREDLLDTAELLGFDIVPFATSYCGDPIFLRPGKAEPDTVFMVYHDAAEKEFVVLADSVSEMVEKVRKENPSR